MWTIPDNRNGLSFQPGIWPHLATVGYQANDLKALTDQERRTLAEYVQKYLGEARPSPRRKLVEDLTHKRDILAGEEKKAALALEQLSLDRKRAAIDLDAQALVKRLAELDATAKVAQTRLEDTRAALTAVSEQLRQAQDEAAQEGMAALAPAMEQARQDIAARQAAARKKLAELGGPLVSELLCLSNVYAQLQQRAEALAR